MPVISLVDFSKRDVIINLTTMFVVPATDKGIFFFNQNNVVGLRVKHAPSEEEDAYWTDKTYQENIEKIDQDVEFIKEHLNNNGLVVLYEMEIFNEINAMEKYAPKTVDYIFEILQRVKEKYSPKGFYNDQKETWL